MLGQKIRFNNLSQKEERLKKQINDKRKKQKRLTLVGFSLEEMYKKELEDNELDMIFIQRICPDCKEKDSFLQGPSGGPSGVNILCKKCGVKFNVCPGICCERIHTGN